MAAHYSEKPSETLQLETQQFLRTLSKLYPCDTCASHMQEYFTQHPPDTSSRQALSLYLCRLHNDVNRTNGAPQFECSMEKLDKRWLENPDCP